MSGICHTLPNVVQKYFLGICDHALFALNNNFSFIMRTHPRPISAYA